MTSNSSIKLKDLDPDSLKPYETEYTHLMNKINAQVSVIHRWLIFGIAGGIAIFSFFWSKGNPWIGIFFYSMAISFLYIYCVRRVDKSISNKYPRIYILENILGYYHYRIPITCMKPTIKTEEGFNIWCHKIYNRLSKKEVTLEYYWNKIYKLSKKRFITPSKRGWDVHYLLWFFILLLMTILANYVPASYP